MLTFVRSNERKEAAHKSGLMAPDGEGRDDNSDNADSQSTRGCTSCGLTSHKRRSSKSCLNSTNKSSQCYKPTSNTDNTNSGDTATADATATDVDTCEVDTCEGQTHFNRIGKYFGTRAG